MIRVFENAEKYNVRIRFGHRSQINDSKFIGYNESSFANLPKVGSQGGYIILVFLNSLKEFLNVSWLKQRWLMCADTMLFAWEFTRGNPLSRLNVIQTLVNYTIL